ncbi:cytochrome c peroxidase [Chloroflexus sp.]|uniref:cytochrome c peroxidase n=1 Tax=Chloroflexus sp. TaxID=1904827 RepID=UPI002ACD22BF|nr:cytochrome c peroxidase [Chloroflexus sp.]
MQRRISITLMIVAAAATAWLLLLVLVSVSALPSPAIPPDLARVELGATLFVEPALSGNGAQSCASCHQAARAFTDGRETAVGSTGEAHSLNTPSVVNAGELSALGWARPDLTSLEAQIAVPLFGTHPVEMGAVGHEAEILGRLKADACYPALFRAAFPDDTEPLRWPRVIDALAAYVRSLRSSGSYDRFLAGEEAALSEEARRGAALFVEIGCSVCHSGPLLTNSSYHNLGLYGFTGLADVPPGQEGLYRITGKARDLGRWRVPSLRNVALTAPYFHDGSETTLEAVLDVYEQGGRGEGRDSPLKSEAIVPITLSREDRAALIAFLTALTDDSPASLVSQVTP